VRAFVRLNLPAGLNDGYCTAVGAGGNSASCSFSVTVVASADLSISLGAVKDPGSTFAYTITVTNAGPTLSCGVVVSDPLPASTAFVSGTTSQGSLITPAVGATGTLTANVGTLGIGGSAVVKVRVKVLVHGSTVIVNKASVSATTPDPNAADNSVTLNTYFFGNKK
jgi:uncharacterized repeat protein (TIGR01451 family)